MNCARAHELVLVARLQVNAKTRVSRSVELNTNYAVISSIPPPSKYKPSRSNLDMHMTLKGGRAPAISSW